MKKSKPQQKNQPAPSSKSRLGRGLNFWIEEAASAQQPPHPQETLAKKAFRASSEATPAKEPVEKTLPAEENPSNSIQELPLALISNNPYQPRKDFDDSHIQELAESIRSEGLLQPILVRKKDKSYELIAGERRLRACKALGLKAVPARVISVNDLSSALIALIENLQRQDLNPMDEAQGFQRLMQEFKLTQEAIAERVGKARASVANALRLLNLDPTVQGFLAKQLLSVGHAKLILALENKAQQMTFARKIIEEKLSVREAEKALKRLQAGQSSISEAAPSQDSKRLAASQAQMHAIEKQITQFFNTKVRLSHGLKKGKILIEYYGNEDLGRILEKLGLSS